MIKAVALLAFLCVATDASSQRLAVRAQNTLSIARADETVSIPWGTVTGAFRGASAVRVKDEAGAEIVSQVVDNDGDGKSDELIFQSHNHGSLFATTIRAMTLHGRAIELRSVFMAKDSKRLRRRCRATGSTCGRRAFMPS
jgi:hypothetical protein